MNPTATRRNFIKQTALLAGMPAIVPASVLGRNGKIAPSNRVVLGGIGLGPRGRQVLGCFLKQADVRFVAIADVQKERREIIRRTVDRHYGDTSCTVHPDMDEVLGRDDVDAVLIATGDRWHAPASIRAARAGKDVYSEKPCTMSIVESRQLDEEILKHGRIFQAGTQRRNVPNFQLAVALARDGKLGALKTVHAGIIPPAEYAPDLPGEPLPDPAVVDWDQWLGTAYMRPFNQKYLRGGWRGHKGLIASYGITEWGSHTVDLCQWAANADDTVPVEYEAEGRTIHATYANGLKLVMREAGFKGEGDWLGFGTCPVRFEGGDGWVEAGDMGKIATADAALLAGRMPAEMGGTDPIHHVREFVDGVKSRARTSANSTIARHGHVACHAAAIAWKLGRKLRFDPATEKFIGDDEANSMLDHPRRDKWDV